MGLCAAEPTTQKVADAPYDDDDPNNEVFLAYAVRACYSLGSWSDSSSQQRPRRTRPSHDGTCNRDCALHDTCERCTSTPLPPVFSDDGLVIVESCPPYLSSGKGAAARWAEAFR